MLKSVAIMLALAVSSAGAQRDSAASVPNLVALVATPKSELVDVVDRFNSDLNSISQRYDANNSPDQRKRMRDFYTGWGDKLAQIDFDKLSQEGKVDYVLLSREIKHELALLDRREVQRQEASVLVPFADRLLSLQDTRRDLVTIDPRASVAVQVIPPDSIHDAEIASIAGGFQERSGAMS